MTGLDLTGLAAINEAQTLTGFSADYLRRLAREKTVPAQKVGASWMFDRAGLVEYKAAMTELGNQKHRRKTTRKQQTSAV